MSETLNPRSLRTRQTGKHRLPEANDHPFPDKTFTPAQVLALGEGYRQAVDTKDHKTVVPDIVAEIYLEDLKEIS